MKMESTQRFKPKFKCIKCYSPCFVLPNPEYISGAFHANISNGGPHQWAVLSSACTGLYQIDKKWPVAAARFVIGHSIKLVEN